MLPSADNLSTMLALCSALSAPRNSARRRATVVVSRVTWQLAPITMKGTQSIRISALCEELQRKRVLLGSDTSLIQFKEAQVAEPQRSGPFRKQSVDVEDFAGQLSVDTAAFSSEPALCALEIDDEGSRLLFEDLPGEHTARIADKQAVLSVWPNGRLGRACSPPQRRRAGGRRPPRRDDALRPAPQSHLCCRFGATRAWPTSRPLGQTDNTDRCGSYPPRD